MSLFDELRVDRIAAAERLRLDATIEAFAPAAHIQRRVLELSNMMVAGCLSPIACEIILARTIAAGASGLTSAVDEALQLSSIHDIDGLAGVVATLRATADVFEAVLRRARS